MAVGDIFSVSFGWLLGPEPAANVMHFNNTVYDGTSTRAALCAALLAEIADIVTNFYEPLLADIITLATLDCFVLQEPTTSAALAPAIVGSVNEDLVSKRSAIVVSTRTQKRGRSFQGRYFLPAVTEGQQSNGTLNPVFKSLIEAYVNDLRIPQDGLGNIWRMTVFSPTLSIFPLGPFEDTLITTQIVRDVLGTQKGRQDVS